MFRLVTHLLAPFNPKAKKWVQGRKDIFRRLADAIPPGEKIIWMHCASLGEFEQGRPVIEKLMASAISNASSDKQSTRHKLLLTFFSPSGYEAQKHYTGADWVFYLLMDGARNARRFMEIVQPALVIFVKYEFWYYYLKKIKYRKIPLLLISALFRKDMSFFKWYGGLQRKILSRFDHLFVQNHASKKLLDDIGLGSITSISGDTRFDRVTSIAQQFVGLPVIEQFAKKDKLIVAGSTWQEDEELLKKASSFLIENKIKLVIAPHEISAKNIDDLLERFPRAIRYSSFSTGSQAGEKHVLIIDNIGMLSRLYNYAWCCYVGGGMRKSGIHNVLEAAVYSKPVLFGPYYKKYQEAINLVTAGGAFSIREKGEFIAILQQFLSDSSFYDITATGAGNYIKMNTGAAEKIMNYIQEKRLLIN